MTSSAPPQATLDDGRRVVLRPTMSADEHAFTAFLQDLDPDSRRLRFHQPVPVVKAWLVRPLVAVDQIEHVCWLAWSDGRVVGEVRYVRSSAHRDQAEIAFAVASDMRHLGLARLLVETIGLVARCAGIEVFTSTVGHDNRASAGFLQALGSRLRIGDGALEGSGPVPEWPHGRALAATVLASHDEAIGRPKEMAA